MNRRGITLEYRRVFLYNETKITELFPRYEMVGMKGRRNGKNRYCKIYD